MAATGGRRTQTTCATRQRGDSQHTRGDGRIDRNRGDRDDRAGELSAVTVSR
jgi:hypothetical protein